MRQMWVTGNPAPPDMLGSLHGFTLIELLVVLAIMVIVIAIAPASLQRLSPKLRVMAASDRLVADLQEMRAHALASSEPARLDRTPNGYRITTRSRAREVMLPAPTQLQITSAGSHREVQTIVVYSDGSTSAVDCELSDSGRHAGIHLDMLTGRTRQIRM
jgi:type II secretion system protein H